MGYHQVAVQIRYCNDLPKFFPCRIPNFVRLELYFENENEIKQSLVDLIKWLQCNNLLLNFDQRVITNYKQRGNHCLTNNVIYDYHVIDEISGTKFLRLYIDRKFVVLNRPTVAETIFENLKKLTEPSLYIYEKNLFIRRHSELFLALTRARRPNKLHQRSCKTTLSHNSVFAMSSKIIIIGHQVQIRRGQKFIEFLKRRFILILKMVTT